jgi:hypothetical protein
MPWTERSLLGLLLGEGGVAHDAGEGVVEVVGHPAGQASDGEEALLAGERRTAGGRRSAAHAPGEAYEGPELRGAPRETQHTVRAGVEGRRRHLPGGGVDGEEDGEGRVDLPDASRHLPGRGVRRGEEEEIGVGRKLRRLVHAANVGVRSRLAEIVREPLAGGGAVLQDQDHGPRHGSPSRCLPFPAARASRRPGTVSNGNDHAIGPGFTRGR